MIIINNNDNKQIVISCSPGTASRTSAPTEVGTTTGGRQGTDGLGTSSKSPLGTGLKSKI